jgi:hypothetical protein
MDYELFRLLICKNCTNYVCKRTSEQINNCDKGITWQKEDDIL